MTIIADLIRAGVDPLVHPELISAVAKLEARVDELESSRVYSRAKNTERMRVVRERASCARTKEPPSLPLDGPPKEYPPIPPKEITPPLSPNPSQENLSVNCREKTAKAQPSETLFELEEPEPKRSPRNDFVRFYEAYPKHVHRKAACAKFETAVKAGVDAERIISAARRYAEACRASFTEKQFVPGPDRWLHVGGYDDEDLPLMARMNGHHDPPIAGRSNGMRGFHANIQRMIEEQRRKDAQEQGNGSA